jgi:hypothetical protein
MQVLNVLHAHSRVPVICFFPFIMPPFAAYHVISFVPERRGMVGQVWEKMGI